MTLDRVQFVLVMIVAAGALGSMWFVTRRALLAAWLGGVQSVAALAMIGTVVWRDNSQWMWLPVWVLTACAAVANWWLCRATERRRRDQWRAELATLVELERKVDVLRHIREQERRADGPVDGSK